MKLPCTKYMLFLAVGLLLLGLAACTQSKPVVPTPTLPASGPPILPQGGTPAATPGLTQGTPPPAATLAPGGTSGPGQPTAAATSKSPGQPTAAATQSTTGPVILPTPTPFGGSQPAVAPTAETQPGGEQPGGSTPGGTETGGNQPTTGGACSNPYIVQRGEWLYSIARKCGVTAGAILAANPGLNPNFVFPGQSLVMPGGGSTSGGTTGGTTGGNTYVVQRGDTMFSIARRFNTTVQALMAINGITNPNFIFVGQVLTIR